MANGVDKRISGTYWERWLVLALPPPTLIVLFILLRNGFEALSLFDALLIVGIGSLLIWTVDCARARHRNPVVLIDGAFLMIGADVVLPTAILSITPLRWFKGGGQQVFEIVYEAGDNVKTATVLSKPDPLRLFADTPKTLRILLRSYPELKNRVLPERTI
jgi:hypothetical protein